MSGVDAARASGREVTFSRYIAAPVALVWELWSDARHLNEWFGPTGYTLTTHEFSFTPGGVWRLVMHAPDGSMNVPTRIVFTSIEPMSRITYTNDWGLDDAPLAFDVAVTFEPERTGTRLAFCMTFANEEAVRVAVERYGVLKGADETLQRVVDYLGRQGVNPPPISA